MDIGSLTDNALFKAYQNVPGVKGVVDGIQKKLGVHQSQEGTPNYKKENVPLATEKIKKAVAPLIGKYGGLEAKATESGSKRDSYAGQMKHAAGLIITAGLVALAATTGFYIPPLY